MATALGATNYLQYRPSLPMPVELKPQQNQEVARWARRGPSCWHQQLNQMPVLTLQSSSQRARGDLVSCGK